MTVHTQPGDGFDVNYLHHTSPRDDIPPQTDPYYGHYSVSEQTPESAGGAHFANPYENFVPTVETTDGFYGRQQAVHVPGPQIYGHPMVTSATAQAPILSQPHPPQFRNHREMEDLRDPTMLQHMTHPSQTMYSQVGTPTSPRTKRRPIGKRPPRSRPSRQPSVDITRPPQPGVSATDARIEQDAYTPQLTLDEKASEEDKFLFQSRQELQGEKGKGMWDVIMTKYEERFHCEIQKPALQMKMSRLIRRCAKWPQSEVSFPFPPSPAW